MEWRDRRDRRRLDDIAAAANARRADDVVASLMTAGVWCAFVAPGSRSTPLVLATVRASMTTHVILDERVAGFCALGAGRVGVASAIITTSGTAVANLLPAACEADRDAVPWVACTADRPVAEVHRGANQTLAQAALLGGAVRAVIDVDAATDGIAWPEQAVRQALCASLAGPDRGPVHLNVRFDKPLEPPTTWATPTPLPSSADHRPIAMADDDVEHLRGCIRARAGLVVCGGLAVNERDDAARVLAWLGWPAVVDVTSGIAVPLTVPRLPSVALRSSTVRETIRPDVVLWLGGPATEDTVSAWLSSSGTSVLQIASARRQRHPPGLTPRFICATPADVLRALGEDGATSSTLAESVRAVCAACADVDIDLVSDIASDIASGIDGHDDEVITEPSTARIVLASQRPGDILFVGNSMPVRDADRFGACPAGVTILSNRGVSGIDGNVATGLGACLATARPTTVFIGDLTLIHDLSGAAAVLQAGAPVRIVVVNNGGGGIFSFLPLAASSAGEVVTDRFFKTPQAFDLSAIARALGFEVTVCTDTESLRTALSTSPRRPSLVEVRCDRVDNVAVHAAIDIAIDDAIGAAIAQCRPPPRPETP